MPIKETQEAEIYDPIIVTPEVLAFPYQPSKSVIYQYTLRVSSIHVRGKFRGKYPRLFEPSVCQNVLPRSAINIVTVKKKNEKICSGPLKP